MTCSIAMQETCGMRWVRMTCTAGTTGRRNFLLLSLADGYRLMCMTISSGCSRLPCLAQSQLSSLTDLHIDLPYYSHRGRGVALDVSRALAYLHTRHPKVVHQVSLTASTDKCTTWSFAALMSAGSMLAQACSSQAQSFAWL